MTAETDEQDLVKALDSVAGAAASIGGVPAVTATPNPSSAGAVSSPFPDSVPSTPPVPTAISTPYLAPDSASSSADASLSTLPRPNDDTTDNMSSGSDGEDTGPLASIKKDALLELRPLVDKLDVSPEEKFDTYLLLIRSTDDKDLIEPAHEAAKAIEDEPRRAEALLNIIKEIDYLSRQNKS